MINAKTKVYGIIGNPVEHSMSPAIHNAAFQALGLNCVYLAFKTTDVKNALAGIRSLQIGGLSVTIPHKQEVMGYLDEIDPVAENIGAVNTVINDNGILKGYNSDGFGAYRAIKTQCDSIAGESVILLGSGGAARAIGFTISAEEKLAELVILGQNEDECHTLSEDIRGKTAHKVTADNIKNADKYLKEAKLLINCTPVGMHPHVDNTPVAGALLHSGLTVFDIVYNPYHTRLLQEAAEKKCRIIYGTEMFLNQAYIQFEMWTQEKAPVSVMRQVLFKNLGIPEKD